MGLSSADEARAKLCQAMPIGDLEYICMYYK